MSTFNDEEKRQIIRAFYIPFLLVYVMWLIKTIEWLWGISFATWGINPRTATGLPGILLSPLLHADWGHLVSNTVPLVVLTAAIAYFYKPIAIKILIIIWLVTGICVWITGRSAYHIGASSLIYGEAAFVFFSGVIRRSITLLAIALLTVFLYGGMIWGIFPIYIKISWESHLFGGITGTVLAVVYRHEGPKTEEKIWEEEPDDNPYWEVKEEESPDSRQLLN